MKLSYHYQHAYPKTRGIKIIEPLWPQTHFQDLVPEC